MTVRSLFAGRKFFTFEMRLSRVEGTRVLEARRLETREEKPLNRSPPVEDVEVLGCVVWVVIIVMRVISRALKQTIS